MSERFARLAALALLIALILALPLLISLFGALNAPARAPSTLPPTAKPSQPTAIPTQATMTAPPSPLAPTPSPTRGCGLPATPEPLWVDPVVSPTNLLTQNIAVTLGRGREISITSNAGTVMQRGEFSLTQPVTLQVPLAPDTLNELLVTAKIEYEPNCFYMLQTRVDRLGQPLIIAQTNSAVGKPTPAATVTASPPGTVFIKPFSQIVGLNQASPAASEMIWLYEAPANSAFRILEQQGAFTRVQSQDGALNFWTLNDNVTLTPALEPVYEKLPTEPQVEFVEGAVFACEGQASGGLVLGACREFQNIGAATALERATVESSTLYLVRFNYQTYWVSARVLTGTPQ